MQEHLCYKCVVSYALVLKLNLPKAGLGILPCPQVFVWREGGRGESRTKPGLLRIDAIRALQHSAS